jgi:AraC family transcriptional regulator, L-rhamnose operon regulatory protein RhaS
MLVVVPSRRPRDPARVHFTQPFASLPDLFTAGRSDTDRASPWHVHAHPGAEIHYLSRGAAWCWHGEEVVHVTAGQIILALPAERHGSRYGVIGPNKMYWLQFGLAEAGEPWFGLAEREAADLTQALSTLPSRHVPVPRTVENAFERLLACALHPDAPLAITRARHALLEILLTVVEHGAKRPPQPSVMVSEAIRMMQAHLAQPLTPEALCAKLGWSRSRFQMVFRAETGVPPTEYYLHLRIMEASERLLEPGATVTGTAGELGFVSSQYFATVFKRVLGLSPQEFRQAARRHADKNAPAAIGPEA